MKQIVFFFVSAILVVSVLGGCQPNTNLNHSQSSQEDSSSLPTPSSETLQELINPNFSDSPYEVVEEGRPDSLTNEEIAAIVAKVPTDKYEAYPHLHTVPLSATLYKNGEVISLDVDDPRIIGLMNLYNNSIYHSQYAYTQGLLDSNTLEEDVLNEEFRLELTFEPKEGKNYMQLTITVTLHLL